MAIKKTVRKTTKNVGKHTKVKGVGALAVPGRLQKALMLAAENDTKFKGNNWQRYGIFKLKEIAGL